MHDPEGCGQRLFHGHHTSPVTCLAVCPHGRRCASGQGGTKPFVLTWDLETLQVLLIESFHHLSQRALFLSCSVVRRVSCSIQSATLLLQQTKLFGNLFIKPLLFGLANTFFLCLFPQVQQRLGGGFFDQCVFCLAWAPDASFLVTVRKVQYTYYIPPPSISSLSLSICSHTNLLKADCCMCLRARALAFFFSCFYAGWCC